MSWGKWTSSDDMIRDTGVHYRALACASLMDNLARQADSIRDHSAFYQPTPGDLTLPHVAKADVAAVAAELLLARNWQGFDEVPLHGPEDLSFDQMASIISGVLGREVKSQEMPLDQFKGFMLSTGATEGMAQAYLEMFQAKNDGMDTMSRSAQRERTPTSFRRWCEEELLPLIVE